MVTVQYRLGSFGFLFLDDEGAPGNVGILDQEKAISWIKGNIFAFGGNPTRITLAGQDAGGVSALIQMIREHNSGKYDPWLRQVILHSAGVQHPWSYIDSGEAFRRSLKLASLLGCSTNATSSRQSVILCLSQKSVDDIVNKEMGAADPSLNFSPFVVTKDRDVVKEEPRVLWRDFAALKKEKDIRILVGGTSGEGSLSLMYHLPKIFPNKNLTKTQLNKQQLGNVVKKLFPDYLPQVSHSM